MGQATFSSYLAAAVPDVAAAAACTFRVPLLLLNVDSTIIRP